VVWKAQKLHDVSLHMGFICSLFYTLFKPLCYKYIVCVPFCSIFSVISILYAILIMVGMWASVCCLVEKTEKKDVMYILPIVYVSMTP
jgi:hypothetical protein